LGYSDKPLAPGAGDSVLAPEYSSKEFEDALARAERVAAMAKLPTPAPSLTPFDSTFPDVPHAESEEYQLVRDLRKQYQVVADDYALINSVKRSSNHFLTTSRPDAKGCR